MSHSFQNVMNEVSLSLKEVYNSEAVVLVPGGGTYAMEAVARQFATDKSCLVLRTAGLVIAGLRFLKWVIFHLSK